MPEGQSQTVNENYFYQFTNIYKINKDYFFQFIDTYEVNENYFYQYINRHDIIYTKKNIAFNNPLRLIFHKTITKPNLQKVWKIKRGKKVLTFHKCNLIVLIKCQSAEVFIALIDHPYLIRNKIRFCLRFQALLHMDYYFLTKCVSSYVNYNKTWLFLPNVPVFNIQGQTIQKTQSTRTVEDTNCIFTEE